VARQIRELPVLMNSSMTIATMARTKTMTRRPMRPQPEHDARYTHQPQRLVWRARSGWEGIMWEPWKLGHPRPGYEHVAKQGPYGVPGDFLYVRETCRAEELESGLDGIRYLADNAFIEIEDSLEAGKRWSQMYHYRGGEGLTIPSIHIPKWATRTWLVNTGVGVERGPEITEADARAEGFESADAFMIWWENQYPGMDWRFVTSYEVIER